MNMARSKGARQLGKQNKCPILCFRLGGGVSLVGDLTMLKLLAVELSRGGREISLVDRDLCSSLG